MKQIVGLFILATILTICSADCRSGLNGRQNWYQCEGLTNLQIPAGAVGIDIVNSNIKKIPTDAFSAYGDSLEELNITESSVEEIEPNAFRGLNKLRVLSLVGTKIHKLDASWIQDLTNLKALVVWRNQISEIDTQLYNLLPNLEIWDVAHNELNACLPPEMLKKLTKLKLIYLAGNPWSYRCRRLMTWYLGRNHIRFVQDWGSSDLLIDECLAHEPNADVDDAALHRCVDRKRGFIEMPETVRLSEQLRELTRKVTELEADVAALKKAAH